MNSKIKSIGINSTKGELLFLQHCMVNLAKNGRCCIIIIIIILYRVRNVAGIMNCECG